MNEYSTNSPLYSIHKYLCMWTSIVLHTCPCMYMYSNPVHHLRTYSCSWYGYPATQYCQRTPGFTSSCTTLAGRRQCRRRATRPRLRRFFSTSPTHSPNTNQTSEWVTCTCTWYCISFWMVLLLLWWSGHLHIVACVKYIVYCTQIYKLAWATVSF